jgi:hypothetical protein
MELSSLFLSWPLLCQRPTLRRNGIHLLWPHLREIKSLVSPTEKSSVPNA